MPYPSNYSLAFLTGSNWVYLDRKEMVNIFGSGSSDGGGGEKEKREEEEEGNTPKAHF